MPRFMEMPKLLTTAHRFATAHVALHAAPNEDAFWEEWDDFTKRNEDRLSDLDFRIICAYARAALRYDGRKRYFAKVISDKLVEFIPYGTREDVAGGLWVRRQQGNIADGAVQSSAEENAA